MESRCYDGSIKPLNELGSIRSVGIKKIMFLLAFEMMLTLGIYLTAGFRVF